MTEKRKKRKRHSQRYVNARRERVVELRLAGLTAPQIAEELRKEPFFKDIKENDVWNDFNWLNAYAGEEEVVSEVMVKDIFQRVRDSNKVLSKSAHNRFKKLGDHIASIERDIGEVESQLRDTESISPDRSSLSSRRDDFRKQLLSFQNQARSETQLILQINDSLADMPRKLGYILERKEVGVYDATKERIIKAVEDEPDPEKQRKLIEAAETLADIL